MKTNGNTAEDIIQNVDPAQASAFKQLHQIIVQNLPKGFEVGISYGALGYVIPHHIYPNGYHCKPSEALPFASIAAQKNSINLYHMGIYAQPSLLAWFVAEYPKHSKQKLDMGKSCIRFKKPAEIPFELIAQLMQKMSVQDWIKLYETEIKK